MLMAGSSAMPLTPQRPSKRALPESSDSPDSPSKNTRSRNPVSNSQPDIPIVVSPTKRRKKDEPDNDLAVWDKSDEEIIGEYRDASQIWYLIQS